MNIIRGCSILLCQQQYNVHYFFQEGCVQYFSGDFYICCTLVHYLTGQCLSDFKDISHDSTMLQCKLPNIYRHHYQNTYITPQKIYILVSFWLKNESGHAGSGMLVQLIYLCCNTPGRCAIRLLLGSCRQYPLTCHLSWHML